MLPSLVQSRSVWVGLFQFSSGDGYVTLRYFGFGYFRLGLGLGWVSLG
jgi:hypothetical protein